MSTTIFAQSVRIASVVASYWIVSISLVFLNKYLLSSDDLKLEAPLFITWFQCVVTIFLCATLGTIAKMAPGTITFPEFKIDLKVSRSVLPLSVIFVAMMTFNNLCLKHVNVSFYYIVRSLTTVFNVRGVFKRIPIVRDSDIIGAIRPEICTYAILGQTTSCKALSCCAIIIFGFIVGVDQEKAVGSLSVLGVLFGVMASLSVALNAIYTKKILPEVDNNIWKLTLYNNVNACFIFLPIMLVLGEIPVVINFSGLTNLYFWVAMVMSGVFGFAIGYVTGLQIQVTSPLTHNISGTAKACAQTVIASAWNAETKTFTWWSSNFIVLGGSMLYTLVKRAEMTEQEVKPLEFADKKLNSEKQVLPK